MKHVTTCLGRADSLRFPAYDPTLWPLDPNVVFLNHGSFGSCTRPILAWQSQLRERMEKQPVQFFVRDLEKLLDEARSDLAVFLKSEPDNLVFVPNSTAGVNTILRSLRFDPGDELLVTNHEYNACRNAINFVAERSQARVVEVKIPFPFKSAEQIVEPIFRAITKRTRLALLDHVSSQTGIIFPLERILPELHRRNIETLIDGAHAPGMIPLNLRKLRPAFYTGNCHKWLCSPKSAGFLYVRKDRQKLIRPLAISHGANSPRKDRSKYLIEFGWTGTWDPSAYLSAPRSIDLLGGLLRGGWPELMERNSALALAGRKVLCSALETNVPCPDEYIGSLASIPLPPAPNQKAPSSPLYNDPLQERLQSRYGIEVPIIPWPRAPQRLLRISAHLYNSLPQYELLAEALGRELR